MIKSGRSLTEDRIPTLLAVVFLYFTLEDILLFWDASKTGKVKFSSGQVPIKKVNLTFPVFSGILSQKSNISSF